MSSRRWRGYFFLLRVQDLRANAHFGALGELDNKLSEEGLCHFLQCLSPRGQRRSIIDPRLRASSLALPARRHLLSWHCRHSRCTLPNRSQQCRCWCLRCWPHC